MIKYVFLLLISMISLVNDSLANDFDMTITKTTNDIQNNIDVMSDKTDYNKQIDSEFNLDEPKPIDDSKLAPVARDKLLNEQTIFALPDESTETLPGYSDELNFEDDVLKNFYDKVVVLVTNKMTAKSQSLDINIGSSAFFGNIEILPLKCWRSPNRYNPESKAFLNIIEHKLHDDSVNIFAGWMFSSSIALRAVEHPIYEVSVLKCHGAKQISNNPIKN